MMLLHVHGDLPHQAYSFLEEMDHLGVTRPAEGEREFKLMIVLETGNGKIVFCSIDADCQ